MGRAIRIDPIIYKLSNGRYDMKLSVKNFGFVFLTCKITLPTDWRREEIMGEEWRGEEN